MRTFSLELRCPDIVTQSDAMLAKAALANSPGFDTVEFDLARHIVVITTANQDAGQDAIYQLAKAGFAPEESTVVQLDPPKVQLR